MHFIEIAINFAILWQDLLNNSKKELEICSSYYDPIISSQYPGWVDTNNPLNASSTNTSSDWLIQNVQVKCDIVRLDSQLNNEFAQRFLSGQTIPISY